MSLKVWSYCLEMVSLVANHRSCLVSRAYWKQERAKEEMEAVLVELALEHAGALEVVDGLADGLRPSAR